MRLPNSWTAFGIEVSAGMTISMYLGLLVISDWRGGAPMRRRTTCMLGHSRITRSVFLTSPSTRSAV